MIFGVGFYSYMIGNVINMIHELDKEQAELQSQVDVLKEFTQKNRLPVKIYNRIHRHLRNHITQKKFKESEKLLMKIPLELRSQIVEKTHLKVFENVKFFKNRSKQFTSKIVHELKPINMGMGDIIYNQGDEPGFIYFIESGRVMVTCDLNEIIEDENLEAYVKQYQQMLINLDPQQDMIEQGIIEKPGVVTLCKYTHGCTFGDTDFFAKE